MRRLNNALTEKERIFCEEYITDLDATKAAIRAGYSEESAKSIAYHLRQREQVDAYIYELLERRSLRLRITADEVLMELAKIGFAEPVDLGEEDRGPQTPFREGRDEAKGDLNTEQTAGGSLDDGNTVEDFPHAAPVLPRPRYSGATMYRVTDVDPVTGRRTVRWFNLSAKIMALRLLGMHVGLFGAVKKGVKKPHIIFPSEDYPPLEKLA